MKLLELKKPDKKDKIVYVRLSGTEFEKLEKIKKDNCSTTSKLILFALKKTYKI